MGSYEKGINDKIDNKSPLPDKLDIGTLQYFWQANPLFGKSRDTIPRYLRDQLVFKDFSDNELRILSKFIHIRTFEPQELIFDQGDPGVGFYLIFTGHVEIFAKDSIDDLSIKEIKENDLTGPYIERHVTLLEKNDYFGELAILQDDSFRTASAVAKDATVLLGIFKPDIEDLINRNPIVGAKFLQAISVIVVNRFASITKEFKILKYKLKKLEGDLES